MTDAEYMEYAAKNCKAEKYKVGETVMVDPDIRVCSAGVTVVPGMCQKAGKKFVIKAKKRNTYYLEGTDCVWQDYMLLPARKSAEANDILKML